MPEPDAQKSEVFFNGLSTEKPTRLPQKTPTSTVRFWAVSPSPSRRLQTFALSFLSPISVCFRRRTVNTRLPSKAARSGREEGKQWQTSFPNLRTPGVIAYELRPASKSRPLRPAET